MNNEDKYFHIMSKYMNNKNDKAFKDMLYINCIIDMKELLSSDADEFNKELFRKGSSIENNNLISKNDKEIIHEHIRENLIIPS